MRLFSAWSVVMAENEMMKRLICDAELIRQSNLLG